MKRKSQILLFVFLCFIVFIIALLIFFNTSPFEPWCHEKEAFIVEGITSNELTKKVKEYYYSNKDIWVWEKNIDNNYSLACKHYSTGFGKYIFSEEDVDILINNKIYSIRIPEAEVVRIEILGIYNSQEEEKRDEKYICISESIGEINRLNRIDDNLLLIKEFENQFIKKLNVNYYWEEPSFINILFRKMYIYLHQLEKI